MAYQLKTKRTRKNAALNSLTETAILSLVAKLGLKCHSLQMKKPKIYKNIRKVKYSHTWTKNIWSFTLRLSKIAYTRKLEVFAVECRLMAMRTFFTFICHDSALLYAISELIENIWILYSTCFPHSVTFCSLSICGIYCIEIIERHSLSLYSLNLDQNLTYSCLKDFRLALKIYLNVSLAVYGLYEKRVRCQWWRYLKQHLFIMMLVSGLTNSILFPIRTPKYLSGLKS